MKAEQRTFSELVDGQRQLLVPLYQRPYSWTKKQRAILVDDIFEKFEDVDTPDNHFLGSVVLAPATGSSFFGIQRLLVVDGQQRLTSLYIFVLAIRDRLRERDQNGAAEKTNDVYLINRHETGESRLKLLPTQLDRTALEHLVDGTTRPDGPSEILNAFDEFSALVDTMDDDRLSRLLNVITSRMEIIAISLSAEDNTFRIFESLNDKGLSLTQGDLLRNHVFMMLPTQGDLVHRTMWADIERNIGSDRIEDLAYLDMVLRGTPTLSKKNTYQAQKNRLTRRAADEDDVIDFVRDLRRRSTYLRSILSPETSDSPTVAAALRRIKRLGNETIHPLALFLLEGRGEGQMSDDDVALALHYAESFLVRRTLAGLTAAGLNRLFTRLPQELDFAEHVPSRIRLILSRPQYRWPNDDELRNNAVRERLYNISRNPTLRHVLLGLEESYGHKELGLINSESLSIEHILPQKPPSSWEAPILTIDGIDPEMQLHCLGNLTLTGLNSEIGNNTFSVKRQTLRSSKLALNVEIASHPQWGSAEILERARELADRVASLWAGPAVAGNQPASASDTRPARVSPGPRVPDGETSGFGCQRPAETAAGLTEPPKAPISGIGTASVPSSSPPRSTRPVRASRSNTARGSTVTPAPLHKSYSGSIEEHLRECLQRVAPGGYLTTNQICAMESSAFKRRGLTRARLDDWLTENERYHTEFWLERTARNVTVYRTR